VVLFGAGGFIGSNLTHRLATAGDHDCLLLALVDSKIRLRFANTPYRFQRRDIGADAAVVDRAVAEREVVVNPVSLVHPSVSPARSRRGGATVAP
jgi:nucleoside-diphosphate-sugar epimerase